MARAKGISAYFLIFFVCYVCAQGFLRAEKQGGAHVTPEFTGIYVHASDILSNLQGEGRRRHFLKLRLTFEVANNDDAKRVNEFMPYIIDQYIIYLRDLRIEDLEGTEGLFLLKKQLLERANIVLAPAQITRVLFREFLLQ